MYRRKKSGLTFDNETILHHIWEILPNGGLIADRNELQIRVDNIKTLSHSFEIEFQKMLEERNAKVK